MKTLAAGLTALFVLAAAPAMAGDQDFTLTNATGYTIEQVYVAPSRSDNWEEDVMGADVLSDGEAVDIVFDAAEGECNFDLKVVYDDGEEAVWSRLDLCTISSVAISYDRASGRTWAETE
ncbi:argininosuccinate lyase [Phenylobacterium sp.]|jgi:hypothetical protein|uniref:argininosuccinate lyase n=1 Tax=Phenylobacterium sp. TaxID=1871053 RepID=UPI00403663D3